MAAFAAWTALAVLGAIGLLAVLLVIGSGRARRHAQPANRTDIPGGPR